MGLGTLITTHYNFEPAVFKIPRIAARGQKLNPTFINSHNTYYDALAHIKVTLALLFDSTLKTGTYYSQAHTTRKTNDHIIDDLIQDPLQSRPNTILLSLDTEEHDNKTPGVVTEYGIAWLDLEKCSHIAPDPNGVNWHRFIEGRSYRNHRFSAHPLVSHCVGGKTTAPIASAPGRYRPEGLLLKLRPTWKQSVKNGQVIIVELNTAGVAVKDNLNKNKKYIGSACQQLALDYKNVRYCIEWYARRNDQAYSGVGFYIKNCNREDLGAQLLLDIKQVPSIFGKVETD
ncbi:MAG: hypothetical protein L6R42_002579 [Xanthoria sp. 1 TBL-2021]|nr:MAG: hypothetical protein L6R42_002579 [Xanthoria sp. 1 TBL-2021]